MCQRQFCNVKVASFKHHAMVHQEKQKLPLQKIIWPFKILFFVILQTLLKRSKVSSTFKVDGKQCRYWCSFSSFQPPQSENTKKTRVTAAQTVACLCAVFLCGFFTLSVETPGVTRPHQFLLLFNLRTSEASLTVRLQEAQQG